MKKKWITVKGIAVRIAQPRTLKELGGSVATQDDLLYLAYRKWEQTIRTYLKQHADQGASPRELQIRADRYLYHRGRRSERTDYPQD